MWGTSRDEYLIKTYFTRNYPGAIYADHVILPRDNAGVLSCHVLYFSSCESLEAGLLNYVVGETEFGLEDGESFHFRTWNRIDTKPLRFLNYPQNPTDYYVQQLLAEHQDNERVSDWALLEQADQAYDKNRQVY